MSSIPKHLPLATSFPCVIAGDRANADREPLPEAVNFPQLAPSLEGSTAVHAMHSLQMLLDVAQQRLLTRREEQLLYQLLLEDDGALGEFY